MQQVLGVIGDPEVTYIKTLHFENLQSKQTDVLLDVHC